jgi:hypothetical protein
MKNGTILTEDALMEIATESKKNIKSTLTPKTPFTFTQHFPAYMDFEPKVETFWRLEDLLRLEYIHDWSTKKGFYGYFGSFDKYDDQCSLMALYDYREDFYGCKSWYCLGFISSDGHKGDIGLVDWKRNIAVHKTNCRKRKYDSIFDDYMWRSEDVQKQMIKDLGYDSTEGIAVCDCGYDELMKR